jgi:UDP-N-acetylmuramate dehydrogenase
MDLDGAIHRRDSVELEFGYRRCRLRGACVLEAELSLPPTDPQALDRRYREIWMYKQDTQPPLGVQSVGCIFRNPDERSAGEIIDRAGLKGQRIGSAVVSQRHANFIVADPGGRAADVIALIRLVQRRVQEQSGIRLEPEVKIWESNVDARSGGRCESAQLAVPSGKED